jgi:hypothetical protein
MTAPACLWCGEPVLPDEEQEPTTVIGDRILRHYECAARAVVGSVGHQLGLCACNGGPGTLDDPSRMGKRSAARLALLTSQALCSAAERGTAELARVTAVLRIGAVAAEEAD